MYGIGSPMHVGLVFSRALFVTTQYIPLAKSAVAGALILCMTQGYKSTSSSVEYPVTRAHRQKDITMPKIKKSGTMADTPATTVE